MIVVNADASEERQQELLERVQELLRADGGVIHHVDDWGRRKIAYAMDKQPEGRFVVMTCDTSAPAIEEMRRVLSISRDVALRYTTVRLSRIEAERAIANGAPVPVDDRPEGEGRAPRGGGRGGRQRGGRR
jgi:small subunit ribosomal protein S6